MMKWIKRLIAKIRYRRFCKSEHHNCPDCIYHKWVWDKDGITFRGNYCQWWKYNYEEGKE